MAEVNEVVETEETVVPITTGFVSAVRTEVATRVTKDLVHEEFILGLQNEKIKLRAEMLKKGYELLQKHSGELNKIRPKRNSPKPSQQKM